MQSYAAVIRNPAYALSVAALLLACAPPERQIGAGRVTGGTIIVSAAADVDALLPPLIAQSSGRQVAEQIFDRLAEIGEDLNTVGDAGFRPVLAERWSWAPDSLSLAFHLRSDARWHDGRSVRAEDVSFTHRLYSDPVVASPAAPLIANIDSVTVRDSLTAVFWFGQRRPSQFFEATYFLLIVPRHALDTVPAARLRQSHFARSPIGSGRFRLAEWQPGISLELVADTGNYRGRPGPDRVLWTVVADFNTAAARLFTGEADVFEFLRPEHVADIGRRDDLKALIHNSLDYGFVQFNLRDPRARERAHPLFADRSLRRALSLAVDRRAIVRSVFDTLGRVAIGPATRGLALADSTVAQLPFDSARASALLDSLGWRLSRDGIRSRDGKRLEFTLLVPSSSRNRVQMAVLLQEQFRRAGVRMNIEQLEYGAFTERGRSRRFDAMFGAWRIDVGPAGIRQTWGTPGSRSPNGLNYGSYENPVFDAHVDSALAAFSITAARAHFRRALETIIADAPAIWMYEPRATLGVHQRLRPARVRGDAWWAGLGDWSVDPGNRLPRDRLGVASAGR